MNAPVVAVAHISNDEPPHPEELPIIVIDDDTINEFETIKNSNVIIGNWEVQNYYRQSIKSILNWADYSNTHSPLYVGAWNYFADPMIHYTQGNVYRTETINVFDDVVLHDYTLTGENRYKNDNVSFGIQKQDGDTSTSASSVDSTKAAINKLKSTDSETLYAEYRYNNNGNPYAWQDLDSINIDFNADVRFNDSSPYASQDWDLELGMYDWSNRLVDGWTKQTGIGANAWSDHICIHTTINFLKPYLARDASKRDSPSSPDILWIRIESEPMLRYPDSLDPYTKNKVKVNVFNSVRQLILNFNESNFNTAEHEYRPLIIFYDGPEKYDLENTLRNSKPIIVNLQAPTRMILYAPNSPVVLIGNEKENLQGFIVAKEYLRLKMTDDFLEELQQEPDKYVQIENDFQSTEKIDNPYYGTQHGNFYRDNGEPQKIKYLYTKIRNEAGGFDMFVDDYGNVQYLPVENFSYKCGTYDTFGRTEFSTHLYSIANSSTTNLFLSGKN